MASVHDHKVESLTANRGERTLRLETSRQWPGEDLRGQVEFLGVAAYHLDGDAFGTILFDIHGADPLVAYRRYALRMQEVHRTAGGHDPWVADPEEAEQWIIAHGLRAFEIESSIGMTGAVWCARVEVSVEDRAAAAPARAECRAHHAHLIRVFLGLDAAVCRDAIVREDFSAVAADIPGPLLRHLETCGDCRNDVLWLIEIRDELDVTAFPCLHLAYGCSSRAGHALELRLGFFAVRIPDQKGHAIVIGYCPWCGIELNVSG